MVLQSEIEKTSPSSWRYTAEGGANIVLSYVGPTSNDLSRKTLRVRKVKLGQGTNTDCQSWKSFDDAEQCAVFAEKVIRPLLGDEQVVAMSQTSVSHTFLLRLRDHLKTLGVRPPERAHVDDVDVNQSFVVIADDLVSTADTLAIEIKPKWGFMPSTSFLLWDTADVKSRHCRFCMHRLLKLHDLGQGVHSINPEERFCPLDLYSSSDKRAKRGIKALLQEWMRTGGKGNNLRIFLLGSRIDPNKTDDVSDLEAFMSNSTLLQPSKKIADQLGDVCLRLEKLLFLAIRSSPLLATLQSLQAQLDILDIEGLHHMIMNETGVDISNPATSNMAATLGEQPTIAEWLTWQRRWISRSKGYQPSLREYVLAYLLAATLKDCSVFVRMTKACNDERILAMKAIDLDPKPLERLGDYYVTDQRIRDYFAQSLAKGLSVTNFECFA